MSDITARLKEAIDGIVERQTATPWVSRTVSVLMLRDALSAIEALEGDRDQLLDDAHGLRGLVETQAAELARLREETISAAKQFKALSVKLNAKEAQLRAEIEHSSAMARLTQEALQPEMDALRAQVEARDAQLAGDYRNQVDAIVVLQRQAIEVRDAEIAGQRVTLNQNAATAVVMAEEANALRGERDRLKAALESPVVQNLLQNAAMYDAPKNTMESHVFGKVARQALLTIKRALAPEELALRREDA